MADQIVSFKKGLSSLTNAQTIVAGQFLAETDTGNLFLDVDDSSRIQIKDNTKVPLNGNSIISGNVTLDGSHILTAPVVNGAVMHGQTLAINDIEPQSATKLVLTGGTDQLVEIGANLTVDQDLTVAGDITGTLINSLTIGSKSYNNSASVNVTLSDLGTFTASANALAAGQPPTVTVDGTAFTFGIPAGATGAQGQPGQDGAPAGFGTPTTSVTTGEPGTNASVVITPSGPDTAKIFDFAFTIPRGATGAQGNQGNPGADGYTFTPSLDASGNLSWVKSQGSGGEAPSPVNIKGPQGDTGSQGPAGQNGSDGYTFTPSLTAEGVLSWSKTQGAGGSAPSSMSIMGPQGPQGTQGPTGPTGAAAGFGTPTYSTTTGAAGTQASVVVTASGENTSKVFDFAFTIPQGAQGIQGPQGPAGADGLTTSVNIAGVSKTQQSGVITFAATEISVDDGSID